MHRPTWAPWLKVRSIRYGALCSSVVVVVVEHYIYLYILLLVRSAGPPHYSCRNNTCRTNNALKRPGIPWPPRTCCCAPPTCFSSDRSPNVMFSTVSAPACQKCYILQMNFNNSYLLQISSIFDRCARCTIPMVWRKCRFWHVRNDTYFQWILTISLFAIMWPSKFLLLPLVSGIFSFCIDFMVDHHDPSPSLVATFLHYLHEIECFCNVFMYALLSVYLLHLQNPQRNFINMMRSKALTLQIFRCA